MADWMASPGHRANILNNRFADIGVAVEKGTYKGSTVWVGVQEFGLPITACPQPSVSEKASIDQMKNLVDSTEASLLAQKAAIDNTSVKYGSEYNAKVEAYNSLVHKYNDLVMSLKSKIADYNEQVSDFNSCAELTGASSQKI